MAVDTARVEKLRKTTNQWSVCEAAGGSGADLAAHQPADGQRVECLSRPRWRYRHEHGADHAVGLE